MKLCFKGYISSRKLNDGNNIPQKIYILISTDQASNGWLALTKRSKKIIQL